MKELWQTSTSESVFDVNLFDIDDFNKAACILPQNKELVLRSTGWASPEREYEALPGKPLQDGFLSLYKGSPKFREEPGALKPLADIIQRGQETPEYKRLRESTVGHSVASIFGANHFIKQVIKNLPEGLKKAATEFESCQNESDEALQNLKDMKIFLEAMVDAPEEKEGQIEAQIKTEIEQLQLLHNTRSAQADFLKQEYDKELQANEAQIAATLNSAAQEAQQKAEEAQSFSNSFGLAAGAGSASDPEVAKLAMIAMRNNPNLAHLAEFLGWAKKTIRGEWRQATKGSSSMVGYAPQELQPARLAPNERMAMTAGTTIQKLDFAIRLTQNTLVHQQFDGDEQSGRGPMVIIRDESGSMQGQRHSLAMALEWALLGIARRDKRGFLSIPFSGKDQYHTWEAPQQGKGDPQGLLDHLSHFYNGGTEPYRPMMRAFKVIEENGLKADILLITDENFSIPPPGFLKQAREIKENIGLKIVVVKIGGSQGDRVLGFADKVINVRDFLADKAQLKEAIREIV